jgi:hypothetical protein
MAFPDRQQALSFAVVDRLEAPLSGAFFLPAGTGRRTPKTGIAAAGRGAAATIPPRFAVPVAAARSPAIKARARTVRWS